MSGGVSPRRVAFDVLRQVSGEGAYANLALAKTLAQADLETRDAAFVTELVAGTCRLRGTYDAIIESASGRGLKTMQLAVVDLLRLLAHQALNMAVPARAAVDTTVKLARETVGQRVTGLINAVGRRITTHDLREWVELLSAGLDENGRLAVATHHPRWIVAAYEKVLPENELAQALEANNLAPKPTLVVRPGLAQVEELAPAVPTMYSPFGAVLDGVPGDLTAVREGRAGVQDEGSQLVCLALDRVNTPDGPWLDLCAGPGGKSALLAGLARRRGEHLVANEVAVHRAELVEKALAVYPPGTVNVICSDGRDSEPVRARCPFSRIMVDAPCSGLGALRRRPEARWRRTPDDVAELVLLQRTLLETAIGLLVPGGVVAYVTCSPHADETTGVVEAVMADFPDLELLDASSLLPEVPNATRRGCVQLWPHRHGTDAMFLALLRCMS